MVQYRIPIKKSTVLPKNMLEEFRLQSGDELVGVIKKGKIILSPNRRENQDSNKSLSFEEKRALTRAKKKIDQINKDMIHSRGLTQKEAHAAIKAGLIEKDQAYFWLEEWQKGERKAEAEIKNGLLGPVCHTVDELFEYLERKK